jgi:hypothetical protein
MKSRRERISIGLEILADYVLDGGVLTILLIITLGAAAILVYHSSPSTSSQPRPFTGRIVEKRISIYESEQGSSFVNDLIIEEPNGRRFKFRVPEDLYARAQVGMWIRRDKRGIELFTGPDPDPAG